MTEISKAERNNDY